MSAYRSTVERHLIPGLGEIPVGELRPADVQAYLNAKAATSLAQRTVAYHRNILRQALGYAERTELVWRNVAKLALPPRIPRREIQPLSPEQARTFLGALATTLLLIAESAFSAQASRLSEGADGVGVRTGATPPT